jgi:hypothetical protein
MKLQVRIQLASKTIGIFFDKLKIGRAKQKENQDRTICYRRRGVELSCDNEIVRDILEWRQNGKTTIYLYLP